MPGTGAFFMMDLGELAVPTRLPGQESVPTQFVEIYASGASGASVIASPAFDIQAIVYIPLDVSAGIARFQVAASAREWLRVESTPEARAVCANASIFAVDGAGDWRGDVPRVPRPIATTASGPAQMVVAVLPPDSVRGNDLLNVSLWVRERFSYLR